MNKIGYLCVLFLLPTACTGQHYSDATVAKAKASDSPANPDNADTLALNLEKSEIVWKGTKMWGRGMHTGIIPIKEGYLLFSNNLLSGGKVTGDMTSIGVTDIPPDQPEPIRILTGHLKDPVFFDVAKYPESTFVITAVEYITNHNLNINGNLTIKGVTKKIAVPASVDSTGCYFTTRFRINRFEWNIAYRGGFGATRFAARNFVDKFIELDISIAPQRLISICDQF